MNNLKSLLLLGTFRRALIDMKYPLGVSPYMSDLSIVARTRDDDLK